MEQTQNGILSAIISACFAMITWISFKEAQIIMGLIASIAAIIAAVFSIRANYYVIKEKKKALKKLNKE